MVSEGWDHRKGVAARDIGCSKDGSYAGKGAERRQIADLERRMRVRRADRLHQKRALGPFVRPETVARDLGRTVDARDGGTHRTLYHRSRNRVCPAATTAAMMLR